MQSLKQHLSNVVIDLDSAINTREKSTIHPVERIGLLGPVLERLRKNVCRLSGAVIAIEDRDRAAEKDLTDELLSEEEVEFVFCHGKKTVVARCAKTGSLNPIVTLKLPEVLKRELRRTIKRDLQTSNDDGDTFEIDVLFTLAGDWAGDVGYQVSVEHSRVFRVVPKHCREINAAARAVDGSMAGAPQ